MKLNSLFIVGVCASTLLASCNPNTATERQLNLTHTTLIDGDAYAFFQLVGTKAVYENDYASYAASVASSSQAKQIAVKAQEVYSALIPALDSLAIEKQVDFPIKGAATFETPSESAVDAQVDVEEVSDEANVDSAEAEITAVTNAATTVSYSDEDYIHHVQQETAIVKEQLKRMTRNTDKEVRAFAEANIEKVTELFSLAGGKEDAHAHH